jgi:undecaprenyl-diphosphatase
MSSRTDPPTAPRRARVLGPLLALAFVVLGLSSLIGRVAAHADIAPPVTTAAPATTGSPTSPTTAAPGSTTGTTTGTTSTTAPEKVDLPVAKAAVLGVVEGVTEFLPISSTGHLLVTQRLLGITSDSTPDNVKEAADAYSIVIQAGAILAVVVLYFRRLVSIAEGVIGRDEDGRKLAVSLIVAFIPAAVVGFALEKTIKAHLFGPWPVVAAWAVGGIALLVLSTRGWWDKERRGADIVNLSIRSALIIGVAQCLALWPGTSRSLVTIVAALLVGLSLSAAVEFSFILGLLTLTAATALDLVKHGGAIYSTFGALSPIVGFVCAFLAAVVAIRWLVAYIQNHSLAIFGWYRLGIAVVTAGLILAGTIS